MKYVVTYRSRQNKHTVYAEYVVRTKNEVLELQLNCPSWCACDVERMKKK